MKKIIVRLVEDYNEYSKLVALNRAHIKEGTCDEETLQWNRGHLSCVRDYLDELSKVVPGVNLEWECGEHTFGQDDWKEQLVYKTVRATFDN